MNSMNGVNSMDSINSMNCMNGVNSINNIKKCYPFTAIVGQEKMKKALVLNVINPLLGEYL